MMGCITLLTVSFNLNIIHVDFSVNNTNIIACRSEDLNSEKIKILVEALAQEEVREFIESTYGPTVNYVFESFIK